MGHWRARAGDVSGTTEPLSVVQGALRGTGMVSRGRTRERGVVESMTEGVPRTRESERPRQAWARLCFALGLMIGASACGAPASDPATGLLAEEIQASLSGGSAGFDHSEWGRLLAGGTDRGLVDYSYMQRHREELDVYLARLADADLASLAPDELKALLINAYNALTVSTILDHAGVSSIREIDGVWTALTHRVGGHEVTLDNIEHNLLRPFFRDPRIHFAVNCASMSCAPLPDWAFQGDLLEEQLEERATSFLRDPLNVRVEADRLLVSSYFDWYGEDFTAEGWSPRANTIAEFIARYGNPEVSELVSGASGRVPLEFMDYDWSLNQVSRPDRGGAGSTAPAPATTVDNAADGGTASEGNTTAARGPGDGSKDAESKGWVTRAQDWIVGLGPVAPIAFGLFYVVYRPLSAARAGRALARGTPEVERRRSSSGAAGLARSGSHPSLSRIPVQRTELLLRTHRSRILAIRADVLGRDAARYGVVRVPGRRRCPGGGSTQRGGFLGPDGPPRRGSGRHIAGCRSGHASGEAGARQGDGRGRPGRRRRGGGWLGRRDLQRLAT